MPELPEVETVCRTLAPMLAGKQFVSFELLWPRTLSTAPETFAAVLTGKTIVEVRRRAKLICIVLSDQSQITIHLRMTGELLWLPPEESPDPDRFPYLRAEFLLDDGSSLLFYDTRKFGRIAWLDSEAVCEMESYFGIEPLSDEFTAAWLKDALAGRHRQIKPLLLDQTFIAGLGNIYVDESLFLARIHPLTPASRVPMRRAADLHAAIVAVLHRALESKGTTLRDYRSGRGEEGSNRRNLQVYGSPEGAPCPRCGTGLKRLVVGQRGTVFCPRCQRRPRITNTQSR